MADQDIAPKPQRSLDVSELENAKVRLAGDNRLRVEFRINDLIKRLMPGGLADSSCGGCNGCSGCSM